MNSRRNSFFLTTGSAVMAFGDGLTLPYLMVYLHFGRGLPLWLAGIVVSVAGATSLVASAPAGAMIDRMRPVHGNVIGLLANAVSMVGLAFSPSAPWAAASLVLGGVSGAVLWPARSVLIYSVAEPELRTKSFAAQFAVINAGIGLGGLVGGQIVQLHSVGTYQVVFLVQAAALCIAALVFEIGFKSFPRLVEDGGRDVQHERGGMFKPLRDGVFMRYMAVYLPITFFGYGQLDGGWAAYVTQYAGATARVVGFAFAANTGVIVLSQMLVVRYVVRLRRSRALALVSMGWTLCWLITLVAATPALRGLAADALMIFSLGLFGLAETVFQPVASMLSNELAPPDQRGRYNAFTSAAWGASGMVGPPIAGALIGIGSALAWAVPVATACAASGLGALRLGKILPKRAEYPEPAES
ncbi:MAG: MFS transporter [Actinomycetota bacterium]|nr:MFS transporter [Actinomycetota bacterium]